MARISLSFFIIAAVYTIFAGFAQLKLNSADASLYLNIAENMVHGRGFILSYDLYQFFTGLYHPVWPYITPIYPLICTAVFGLGGGMVQVVQLNIFLLGINAALIFWLLQNLMPTRLNLLFLTALVFSSNFYLTALLAWTEQLHLCLFLLSFMAFVNSRDNPRRLAAVGAFNGVIFLLRVAHIYSIVAYLVVMALSGERRARTANIFSFMAGFLAVLVPYEAVSWIKYHAIYPQYLKPAGAYTMGRISAAPFYKEGTLGLINPLGYHFAWINFLNHLKDYLKQMYWFYVPVFGWLFMDSKKEGRYFMINCLAQSGIIMLCYAQSLGWTYLNEAVRYSLVPYVLSALAGWYALYEFAFVPGRYWRRWVAVFLLVFLAGRAFVGFCSERRDLLDFPREQRPYYRDLFAGYRWIRGHLPQEILVASDSVQEGYFMHRPFISTPPGKSYTCRNLEIYNRIYKPDYYLLSDRTPDTCFENIRHTVIFTNPTFRILQIKK